MSDDVALPPARAARRAVASWAMLGAILPAVAFVGATGPPASSIGYLLGALVCIVATATGIRRNVAPGDRRPWLSMLAGESLSFAGEAVRILTTVVDSPPHSILAMVPIAVVLPTYLLLIAGVLDLARRSRAADDDPARVDAVLIGIGAALLVWCLWIEPWFAGDDPRWESLVAAVLPLAAALPLVIAMPMLMLGRARTPALWLFATSGVALLAANMVLATRGWFPDGSEAVPLQFMGVLVLIAEAAIAACVLHPTVGVLTQRVRTRSRLLRKARTAVIAATLCVPTVLSVVSPPADRTFTLVRALLSLALIGAVVSRVVRANNSRVRAEQETLWRAEHDPLTGLPNRAKLAAVADGRSRVSVLLLGLDRFKVINDQWGHEVGDELLRAVAGRLTAAVREEDLVCRIGGDEFVVVLAAPGEPAERAPEDGPDAEPLAQRLLAALAVPLPLSVGAVDVTASIGIAHADGRPSAELLRDADTAMYVAKGSGRNRYAVFDPLLRERLQRRLTLEHAFRGALGGGQLDVHYQPLVDLATDRIDGFEALMRWTHPELGAVSPVEFIPVAEDTGMIVAAGAWLLENAAAQTRGWRAAHPLHVSVNLAVRQLREPGLADRVRDVLTRTGLPAEALWLEITESGFMEDPDTCLRTLHELRDLGITLCIDDFGTGYSSLSYLQRLPVAVVKIDRAFVAGVGDGGANESIVRAVLAMSHALGHRVVAEGVETVTQRDWLRASGCDFAQGWLYGRPLPAAEQDVLLGRLSAVR
ncbi:EAL domain-containing protein [Actinoplanes sp. NEAU-A12]|uniref:EAL domain-containing protein n=1 Tax=Actinoplanes sandaracinus TaxID=3045177 RepID=A0ABT6WHW4_9ACTN|nr:EAL domain-containing protein [Actinoplanes sandaracinus]MDI6099310.1 EAL domain-containing protein [Actinoplanes sandaracinus]